MLVQLLYFDGCPHWTLAEERLTEAMRMADAIVPIEKVRVETMDDANRMHFTGSPTTLSGATESFQFMILTTRPGDIQSTMQPILVSQERPVVTSPRPT